MNETYDYGEGAEPREEARHAVQVAMDRRDNGGDGE